MPVKQYASLGGKKRAESLSPERQREIARRATHRRWMKKRQRDQKPAEPATDDASIFELDSNIPTDGAQDTPRAKTLEPAQVNYAKPDTRTDYERKANLGVRWNFDDPYLRWIERERKRAWASAV